MKPQTIGLVVASTITGVFLAAVGFVLAWQTFDLGALNPPQQGNFAMQFAPAPDFAVQNEQPVPQQELPKARGKMVPTKDYALSEPVTHGNLTIFLVQGKDTMKQTKILTLQEALEQNVAVVHDTGHVLTIQNRGNAPLFIQSGDIVKGGNQDRTLPYDMLVPANNEAGMVAMCVESGRSFPRGNELSASFQTSTEQLPGRKLKLAAYKQAQAEVWNNVQMLQDNLAKSAGGSVKSPLSQTSLQLSLEHPRVQEAVQAYLTPLAAAPQGKNDAIGYVVVVNGKIQTADIYASNALFLKLWPKLIRASAVEALSQKQPGAVNDAPDADAVLAFLADAEKGQAFRVEAANRTTVIRQETGESLLFDTCDPSQQNLVLHRSFLVK